jgi:D-Tyr-tRNAtyr deacylase
LGVGVGDSEEDAEWLADKIANLRIFEDGGFDSRPYQIF